MRFAHGLPALLLAIIAAGCNGDGAPAPSGETFDRAASEDVIAGGYGTGDLEDPATQTAYQIVLDAIAERYPSRALVEKKEVEVQVVAGLNYRFRIEMSGDPQTRAIYEAVVYRDLDDTYELTRLDRLQ